MSLIHVNPWEHSTWEHLLRSSLCSSVKMTLHHQSCDISMLEYVRHRNEDSFESKFCCLYLWRHSYTSSCSSQCLSSSPPATWHLTIASSESQEILEQWCYNFIIVLKLVFSIWHELVLGLVDNVAIRQRKQVAIKTECRPPPAAADNVEEWTRTRQNMTNNCGVTVGPHFVLFLINI